MRDRLVLLLLLVLLACWSAPGASAARPGPALLYSPPPRVPQLSVSAPFHAAPLLVSGTDAYRRGEYLYQDYLFDDHGADTVPGSGSSALWGSMPLFAPTAGDVLYPTDSRFYGDAADLVELRMRVVGGAIVYRVTFGAPTAAGTVVAGIGIDTHPSGASAGVAVAWPYDAGVSSPGLDWFITAWGSGGTLTRMSDGHRVPLAVGWNQTRAQMTIRVPLSLMNPGRAVWRYVAGTGLWDGRGWTPVVPGASPQASQPVSGSPIVGAPAVFNLAFRFHEPVAFSQLSGGTPMPQLSGGTPYTTAPGIGNWFEDGQARWLSERTTGDDYADVDFGALARGADAWVHAPGRVQARIYGSRFSIPPGVNHDAFPEFGGALQPYLVRLAPGYRPGHPAPVLFALHASNSNYELYNVFMPNWGRELGDERDSFVVTPLARGLDGPDPVSGAFTGAAEADFFETWADFARHFTIDRSRVVLSGYSLGAYAAYALAETWPDLFARVFSVVGAPPSNGMNTELLGNLRWVPLLAWNQADDSEVPYTDARTAEAALTALGLRHEWWTFPAGGHLAPALRDDWSPAVQWLGDPRVVRDPDRVDLGVFPALDDRRFELVHDHAYWVSGVRVARGASHGSLSVRSLAFGLGDAPAVEYSGTGSSGGSAALIHGVRWGPVPRTARSNTLQLTLSGVSRLVVAGAGARLRGDRRLVVRVSTNVRATVIVVLHACGRRQRRVRIVAMPGVRAFAVAPVSCARLRSPPRTRRVRG
jgi:Prolyl oligopeptidase family